MPRSLFDRIQRHHDQLLEQALVSPADCRR